MYDFHRDKKTYFDIQYKTAKNFIIPFLEDHSISIDGKRVMEVGCAEAGVLKAFLDKDCICTGVELSAGRMALAKKFLSQHPMKTNLTLISKNIYDMEPLGVSHGGFDLIVLKDVIEHIPNQVKLLQKLSEFLAPEGVIFIAFPPWWMPFGGHQQICSSKLLQSLPYFHLLPGWLYRLVLKMGKEPPNIIRELMELKKTGLKIEDFEKFTGRSSYKIITRQFYLFNPIYQYKFGLKPRLLPRFVAIIPYFRNFLTTAMYYIIKRN